MKKHSWFKLLCAVWLILAGLAAGGSTAEAGGRSPDLDTKVRKRPKSHELVRVIVQFKRPGVLRSLLARDAGGRVVRDHAGIDGVTLELPLKVVDWLTRHPDVAWVSPDRALGATWDYAPQALGADQLWAGAVQNTPIKGTGTRVAILDTGIAPVGDLSRVSNGASRIVGWKDIVNNQPAPYDDNGHGTHIAGIIASAGQASNGLFKGVAPDVDLVGVKVLDENGSGAVSNVIAGIDWCVANKSLYNLRAINLSLGHDPAESFTTDPLCAAVRRAVRAGIVVVVSGGNKGKDAIGKTLYGGISCPGNDPSVITVGALNTKETVGRGDDTVCTYSSRGPTFIDHVTKPDLVAPGNRIVSLRATGSWLDNHYPSNRILPATYGSLSLTPSYYSLSGTSMAAPQVTGTVALMLQANPNLKPNAVKGILMFTAQKLTLTDALGVPLPSGLQVLAQGSGSINTLGAVDLAESLDTNAPVGVNWLRRMLRRNSTIGGQSVAWRMEVLHRGKVLTGDEVMAIRQSLWGDTAEWSDQVVWGGQVTWGDDMVPSDQVIWGNEALWGDPTLWGENAVYGEFFLNGIFGDS